MRHGFRLVELARRWPQSRCALANAGLQHGQRPALPPRIKPHRGQVSKDCSKSSNSEHWAVFHEYESRFHFANDPEHFTPKPGAFASQSQSFPGHANVLARKPAADDIDAAFPSLSIKGSHVVPYRESFEQSIALSGEQNSPWIFSKFNSADGAPSKEFSAQDASSRSCKKCQLIHGSSLKKTANTALKRDAPR